MKTITIYCAFMDKESLHAALQHSLSFPNYYGANLDALYDCLTELEEDTHLILQNILPSPAFGKLWRKLPAIIPILLSAFCKKL